jgi:hypothetical protein
VAPIDSAVRPDLGADAAEAVPGPGPEPGLNTEPAADAPDTEPEREPDTEPEREPDTEPEPVLEPDPGTPAAP